MLAWTLCKKGALPWSGPHDVDSLNGFFNKATSTAPLKGGFSRSSSDNLSPAGVDSSLPVDTKCHLQKREHCSQPHQQPAALLEEAKVSPQPVSTPAEMLFSVARTVIGQLLSELMKDGEVTSALGVSNVQTKGWLQRLVEDGVLEKQKSQ